MKSAFVFVLLGLLPLNAAEVTPEQVNAALGAQLFADGNLWDDDGKAVAERLGWPQESETSTDASYRLYAKDTVKLLGCRPYSCSLFAEQGKASGISIMFANKGDGVSVDSKTTDPKKVRERTEQIREFKKTIAEDARTIASKLTELLGKPTADKMGQGRLTSESVKRWDWQGHAFLLASPRDEYVALRIVTVKSADDGGRSRVSDVELAARAKTRVERRPNGDVILKDIPMVNQGPKGYCVPATWERVMRYMGVPADMYILAMAGDTGAGGGSSVTAIAAGAKESIMRSGRKIESAAIKPDPVSVAKYIDRGLPVMWAMFSTKEYNDIADARTKAREGVTDASEWRKAIADSRKGQKPLKVDRNTAHMCMIIGYNKDTGEIAVSDSWGDQFAERWILGVEAGQVSQGQFVVVGY
jgi:hypothetical protein